MMPNLFAVAVYTAAVATLLQDIVMQLPLTLSRRAPPR